MDAERFKAWQCIGCGRIEGAQPCIGICQDRKAEFVHAAEYDEVVGKLAAARSEVEVLATVVRQMACIRPREGACERTYRALQDKARQVLAQLPKTGRPAVALPPRAQT